MGEWVEGRRVEGRKYGGIEDGRMEGELVGGGMDGNFKVDRVSFINKYGNVQNVVRIFADPINLYCD